MEPTKPICSTLEMPTNHEGHGHSWYAGCFMTSRLPESDGLATDTQLCGNLKTSC